IRCSRNMTRREARTIRPRVSGTTASSIPPKPAATSDSDCRSRTTRRSKIRGSGCLECSCRQRMPEQLWFVFDLGNTVVKLAYERVLQKICAESAVTRDDLVDILEDAGGY